MGAHMNNSISVGLKNLEALETLETLRGLKALKKIKKSHGTFKLKLTTSLLMILTWGFSNYGHGQVNLEGKPFPKLTTRIETKQTLTGNQSNAQSNVQPNSQSTRKIDTSVKSSEIPKLLGKERAQIAKWYNIPEEEFDKKCQNDKCVKVDQDGRLFHACAGLALSPEKAQRLISQENPESSPNFNYDIETDMAFELESMPNAKRTIYLDFNGHITRGTFWNGTDRPEIVHPPMDLFTPGVGLTPDYFTEHELQAIIRIWKQVCEDFSPYEVNVTTKEPPLDKLIKSNNTDQEYGIRVVVGGTGRNFLNASYGGIAYVGSFSWANDTPTFAFSDNLGRVPKYIAEVISHEVGHTAGLWHHGRTDGATYHTGDGLWAPIMGSTYVARVGQWSKGEYPLANNKNPDMEIMSQYMPFKEDIEAHPARNPILGQPLYGTIHRPNEIDSFFLDLQGGTITIRVELPEYFANTDLCMNLKDEAGSIVSTHKFYPSPYVTADVKKGNYTLELFGASFVAAGNSSYGSTGEYKLTITQDSVIPHITKAQITQNDDLMVVSNLETYPPTSNPLISYSWEIATYNAPQNFRKIEGLTGSSLNINDPGMLGKYIRATLTPKTEDKENRSFTTKPIKIVAQPPKEVIAKEFFEFSSLLKINKNTHQGMGIIVNEISQGHRFGKNPEWMELLTLKEIDLRGYSIKTKTNDALVFKNMPTWSEIPEGTLIVIYNGSEKDPLIGEDKFLPHTERLIIASSTDTSLFEGAWPKLKAPQGIALNTGAENNIKTTYASATINIDGVNWVLNDVLIGQDQRDMKEQTKSFRLKNGYMETQDYLKEGIEDISFLYSRANFSGDRTGVSPTFQVSYSTKDNPNIWIPVGREINVYNDNLEKFTASVNYDGEYKIKIAKVSGTKNKRWNIDDIKITESSTMNFVQILDVQNQPIQELTFGYSAKAIKNGFLLPNTTESFTSGETSKIKEGNNWIDKAWSKNSTSITPGKGNSIENQQLVLNLSNDTEGTLPTYWLENAPEGLSINKETGRVFGAINKGGFYNIKVNKSNGLKSEFELVPILVKQSFSNAFSDNPEIANNPQGDHNNNGIANIVEFALGNNAKLETSIVKLSDILNIINPNAQKTQKAQGTQDNEPEQLVLSITYMRNKTALGVEVTPQWSTNLIDWETEGIKSAAIEDQGEEEKVISWMSIPQNSPAEQKLFMRISVTQE